MPYESCDPPKRVDESEDELRVWRQDRAFAVVLVIAAGIAVALVWYELVPARWFTGTTDSGMPEAKSNYGLVPILTLVVSVIAGLEIWFRHVRHVSSNETVTRAVRTFWWLVRVAAIMGLGAFVMSV